jgi:hypothetical protein
MDTGGLARERLSIWLEPGDVRRADNFSITYRTSDGGPLRLCSLPSTGAALTVLRSPSGRGKSTLIERFVRCLRDNVSFASGALRFSASGGGRDIEPLSVAVVPQHPPFVRHWPLHRLLPPDTWSAPAGFGNEWEGLKSRLLGHLSGGQQRRVYACSALEMLARSESDASVLVLDETLDGLNPSGAGAFIEGITQRWATVTEAPLLLFVVTHLPVLEVALTPAALALEVIREASTRLEVKVVP